MAARTDDGVELTADQIRRLLDLPAYVTTDRIRDVPDAVVASVDRGRAATPAGHQ